VRRTHAAMIVVERVQGTLRCGNRIEQVLPSRHEGT
jgi:hypothetical protein